MSIYKALVQPTLDYACTVWSPDLQQDRDKIQAVQRRGARFVFNRYHNTSSPTEMLSSLEWETLESRRTRLRLSMFYNIHHRLVDISPPSYICLGPVRARRSTISRDLYYFNIHKGTDYYKSTFFPFTINIWNSLPASAVHARSIDSFKVEIGNLQFPYPNKL